jgi:hypothetical protein
MTKFLSTEQIVHRECQRQQGHEIPCRFAVDQRGRDCFAIEHLAMFKLAIDSKLRGCDVVALKVEDVAPGGYAIDRATVRQKRLASRSGLN